MEFGIIEGAGLSIFVHLILFRSVCFRIRYVRRCILIKIGNRYSFQGILYLEICIVTYFFKEIEILLNYENFHRFLNK